MDPILRPQQPTISPCVHRIPVHEPFDLGRSRYSRYKPIPIQRFTTSGVLSSPGEQHSQPCRQPLKFSKQKWVVLDAINKTGSLKETACALHLTEKTVGYHVATIKQQFHFSSLWDVIRLAQRLSFH